MVRVKRMNPAAFARRVVRHLAWRGERAYTLTADRMRRGDRTVIMTPPAGLRFGNWLYLWLDAHERSSRGETTRVLHVAAMDPWLEAFPSLRPLTVSREQLRFHDRREWNERSWHQRFGVDFSREALRAFIKDVLGPFIQPDQTDAVVLNIRRGDYYSNPGLHARYGFDQLGYLRAALRAAGRSERALVVSDDIQWCRENLDGVIRQWHDRVDYAEPGAVANFLAVSAARTLIGTNSTFSYWGGYIADALHDDALIVMPRFHARIEENTDAYQLDPDWTIIDGFH